jgi:hypothetical protein
MKGQVALWTRILENLTLNREQALLEAGNDAQALLVLDPGSLPRLKVRPHRGLIALAAGVVAAGLSWVYRNRSFLRGLLATKGAA